MPIKSEVNPPIIEIEWAMGRELTVVRSIGSFFTGSLRLIIEDGI